MTKKNFYCERLNAGEQNQLSGGMSNGSYGGTDLGGPSSGGGAGTVCVCACGGIIGYIMDSLEEAGVLDQE